VISTFEDPKVSQEAWIIMVVFETIFGISMILNFMVEYYPDGSTIPMRNMKKIAMRYIKS
jgi:hypothetical protein